MKTKEEIADSMGKTIGKYLTKKKKTTKKSLGLGMEKKPLTKRELAIKESQRKKAIEMAKPVDRDLDEIYKGIQFHRKEMDRLYGLIMDFAPGSIKKGFRFESFIYIKESEIPDRDKLDLLFEENARDIPVHDVINWKRAVEIAKIENWDYTKKKKAYLREVKKK